MADSPKYARTHHLPWSPGGTNDDRRLSSVKHLLSKPLVTTEKLDGSCVCLEANGCYARSHASAPSHPSFDAFKAFHAKVRHAIPEGTQIFGEWLYAKHSISYSALSHFFQLFAVRNLATGEWGSWETVELWAEEIGAPAAPVLARGEAKTETELRALTLKLAGQPSVFGGEREGLVVRVAAGFAGSDFDVSVAKHVRANHVQTDDHWKNQEIVRNRLAPLTRMR